MELGIKMSSSDPTELFFVMKSLESALKSIDVRTFAVTPNPHNPWQNLVTSVYLSEKTVEEVKKQHTSIPLLRQNNKIRLYLRVDPFNDQFVRELLDGQVKFLTESGREIVYFRKLDPTRLKMRSTKEKIVSSYMWILEATSNGTQRERGELWSTASEKEIEAKLSGFQNISKLIENRLRIQYSNGSQKDFDFIVPSLASIDNTRFSKTRFEVDIKKVEGLTNLQLNLSHTRDNDVISIEPRKVKENPSQNNGLTTTETFELRNALPYDQITVNLILEDSALQLDYNWSFVPLENVVEPFLKTLDGFCSLEKLESMILEPENYGKPSDKIFEMAITWLVSLSGYSSIPLWYKIKRKAKTGKFVNETFETFRTETGCEIGSIDIIAYEKSKRLLLIDCSIGSPDPNKISKMVDLGRYLSTLRKEYGKLKIIPVLVTPKIYHDQPQRGLCIVDQKLLKQIFEEISKGNTDRARDIFCWHGY